MNELLGMLMNAAGGGAVQQLGQRFGLSADQTGSALNQLVPALMAGLRKNSAQEGGMEALLGALSGGNHAQYLDNPELLANEATSQEGNAILGHIFGSKDASRAVASRAAEQTGIDAGILKQMLPVAAAMVMGGLGRQHAASGHESGAAGLLSSLLDQDRDGSVADDIAGMLGRFLTR